MTPIYLANNKAIYHFCKGKVYQMPLSNVFRQYVYRSYYIRYDDNFKCKVKGCPVTIPAILFLGSNYITKVRGGIITYYPEGVQENHIPRQLFKKYFQPEKIYVCSK